MKFAKEDYFWTIRHIVKHGDTDIFPFPIELKFLDDKSEEISEELSKLDVSNYSPMSYIESLAPKSRFGFRLAHQIFPIDLVIFTTMIRSVAPHIEASRIWKDDRIAFSYRYVGNQNFEFFDSEFNFHNWINNQIIRVFDDNKKSVIKTDLSDFYMRIYRHRLKNCLEDYSGDKSKVKHIERFLSEWRGKQSFGLPVGSNASRLLAEVALCDTDFFLQSQGIEFSRYVDDFLIFVKNDQDEFAILSSLAEHLAVNEGLSLNIQKTKIESFADWASRHHEPSGEDQDQADKAGTEKLFYLAYDQEDVDPEKLAELMAQDIAGELVEEYSKDFWDTGKIRILLRALRLTKSRAASDFIKANIDNLLPFAKDIVLLMEELKNDGETAFDDMSDRIIEVIFSERLNSLSVTRAWLLELFVRGVVDIQPVQVRQLDRLSQTLDKRQLYQLHARVNDLSFFRREKTRVHELSAWLQPAFIYAAKCLPPDEYNAWIKSIRTRLGFPLAQVYCKWCGD